MAGSFDGARQNALMFRTSAGLAARADFTFLCYETAQDIRLFIINRKVLIRAELAYFRAGEVAPLTALVHIIFISRFTFHKNFDSNLFWQRRLSLIENLAAD
jgi:hypothetical protein